MKPVRNPELEALRESGLKENKDYKIEALTLAKSCKNIHAIYLFHPEGIHALKNLCLIMSSTPTTIQFTTWKDLAGYLGLSFHEIGCIENYRYEDVTEMVLKTFAQRKDARLSSIVEGLNQCCRYDVISAIMKPLEGLIAVANRLAVKNDVPGDGYLSLTESFKTAIGDGILRPQGYDQLRYQLPITLRELIDSSKTDGEIRNEQGVNLNLQVQTEAVQYSSVINLSPRQTHQGCSKKVMVTFSKDGEVLANLLARKFRKSRHGMLPIGVLILNEHPDKVSGNPEKFIIHYFSKMDFVIPILTEGYLDSLGKRPEPGVTWTSSLDPCYVQLIHDLMIKYYAENCCRNDKIRCVIPNDQVVRVLEHPHMKIDPVLKVYVKESEIEILADRILHSKKKRPWGNSSLN